MNILKKALLSAIVFCNVSLNAEVIKTDICIYGATSSGIIAGVSADRMGKGVVIVEPSQFIGGMSASGLGKTDIGNKMAITGLSRDFYRSIGKYYGKLEMWTFEPHVAETVFSNYLSKTKVSLIKGYEVRALIKSVGKITQITVADVENPTKDPITIQAKMFIDASYEGDLMAKAGVSYTIGRESNATYNETYNGFQLSEKHQFPDSISPYINPKNTNSGYVYGVSNNIPVATGTGDKLVQAYNYRLCLTKNEDNKIPIQKPENYDPQKYELLRRVIAQREKKKWKHLLVSYFNIGHLPNGKTDINNNGPFSTDFIGENYNYPEADYKTRKQIEQKHIDYIKGLLYFMAYDPAVPDTLRQQMQAWGYCKDEFQKTGGFPHQIYVREARRMIGEYVMTEHNCLGKEKIKDGVGMAAYGMDSHNCQRIAINGFVKNEGDVQIGGFPPYPVSYRSITPKRNECTNLLVPVCLSASHIAYGSIRMEPVFMVLGQSAAIAASLAIDQNIAVQKVNVKTIQSILAKNPYLDGRKPEVLVDNSDIKQVKLKGKWELPAKPIASNKMDYLMVVADGKSATEVLFTPKMVDFGMYDVYLYCPEKPINTPEWAPSVDVEIFTGQDTNKITVDQKANSHHWVKLGRYELNYKKNISVKVIANKPGVVIADAVLFVPVK